MYSKKGGALEFIVKDDRRSTQADGELGRRPHASSLVGARPGGGRVIEIDKHGDRHPAASAGVAPISRTTLALYAGASGDHNPIHIDLDVARSAGLDDVFAHGMLSMAYLGRLLTGWVPQERIRSFQVRFAAITPVHGQPDVHRPGRDPSRTAWPPSSSPSLSPTAP